MGRKIKKIQECKIRIRMRVSCQNANVRKRREKRNHFKVTSMIFIVTQGHGNIENEW